MKSGKDNVEDGSDVSVDISGNNSGENNVEQAKKHKKRRSNYAKMVRITISITEGLLEIVDEAAVNDFATRSGTICTALLWYLRPQGRDLDQADPEEILKTLQNRRTKVALNAILKDLDMNI